MSRDSTGKFGKYAGEHQHKSNSSSHIKYAHAEIKLPVFTEISNQTKPLESLHIVYVYCTCASRAIRQ
mgnify:CR=1 FL=1